mmetsp:Transcript_27998/g.80394  ORF Transcript_27998/g.80394 Transcript_27998/m.80394 type:complete len:204 (+) Transcript_27998:578-1189(+)
MASIGATRSKAARSCRRPRTTRSAARPPAAIRAGRRLAGYGPRRFVGVHGAPQRTAGRRIASARRSSSMALVCRMGPVAARHLGWRQGRRQEAFHGLRKLARTRSSAWAKPSAWRRRMPIPTLPRRTPACPPPQRRRPGSPRRRGRTGVVPRSGVGDDMRESSPPPPGPPPSSRRRERTRSGGPPSRCGTCRSSTRASCSSAC